MSLAVCNPDAFDPLRSLVQGPLRNPADLPRIERFIRTIVLHDKTKMIMEPWPDMDQGHEWSVDEIAAGGRNVITAVGPVIDEYERHNLLEYENLPEARSRNDLDISGELRQLAQNRAMTDSGPYFEAHLEFIRVLLGTLASGGSLVLEDSFADEVIDLTSQFPEGCFAQLDHEWAELIRSVDGGDIGLIVPPFLAMLLNRCARRDAILNVLEDMKNELRDSREKVWSLIHAFKEARTIAEANEIKRELQQAGELMSPTRDWPAISPVRTLWRVFASALGGGGWWGNRRQPVGGSGWSYLQSVCRSHW